MPKEGTLKTTFVRTALPLHLLHWTTICFLPGILISLTAGEEDGMRFISTARFAAARDHLFFKAAASHPSPNFTYITHLTLHKEDPKETKSLIPLYHSGAFYCATSL